MKPKMRNSDTLKEPEGAIICVEEFLHWLLSFNRVGIMAANTYLLHFRVDRSKLINVKTYELQMTKSLGKYISGLTTVNSLPMGDGGLFISYTAQHDSIVTVRVFIDGTVIMNIDHFRKGNEEEMLPHEQYDSMLNGIAEILGSQHYQNFPVLERGPKRKYWLPMNDKRLMELDIDKVVFEETSPYQLVKVCQSKSLGNLLFLDRTAVQASKDTVYNENAMHRGRVDHRGKDVLILGGGSGALLYEILKENPKSVVAIELDEVVVRASRIHMREANGGILDSLKGPNYEIIIGDCLPYVKKYIKDGRMFDCIIEDVFLESQDARADESTGFTFSSIQKELIQLCFNMLKPSGKYLASIWPEDGKIFESNLKHMKEPVEFSKHVAFVPHFLEFWHFYQIWRKNTQD